MRGNGGLRLTSLNISRPQGEAVPLSMRDWMGRQVSLIWQVIIILLQLRDDRRDWDEQGLASLKS